MRTIFVILFLLVVKSNSIDFGSVGDLANSVGKLAENFGSTVSNLSQNVGSHIGSIFDGAVQNAGGAWSNLTANVGVKWNELTNTSKVVAGNLGENINKAFGENGAVGNLTLHLGSTLEQKFSELGALASKVKARLISDFSNETVIEQIATILNERHNEASNDSNPLWKPSSSGLQKFQTALSTLKNATNLPNYCTPVRDRAVGLIESENEQLTPYAYKDIIDLIMGDAQLTDNEKIACYKAMADDAKIRK